MITNIIQISKNKVQVLFDGEPVFMCQTKTARDLGIKDDREWDAQEMAALEREIRKLCIRAAADLLVTKDYSERQLAEKLSQKGFRDDFTAMALDYMKEKHFLDDLRMAEHYIEINRQRRSKMDIQCKLIQKGISKDIIARAFDCLEWDDTEPLKELILKKYPDPQLLRNLDQKSKDKLIRSLLSKGYAYQTVRKTLDIMCF